MPIRSILLIDDDRDDFELLSDAVMELDPDISVFYLDKCEEGNKYKDQNFDLVLLDINMPYHDGFSWLKGIRDYGYNNPVIMYSNSSSPSNIFKAYDEGASLYFPKPESFSKLKEGMNKLINMDWSNPLKIKEQYKRNGTYLTFQV